MREEERERGRVQEGKLRGREKEANEKGGKERETVKERKVISIANMNHTPHIIPSSGPN